MGLYADTSFDLMCQQINRDNPDMAVPFNSATVILLQGPLTNNLGSSGRNTRAIFNGVQGSGIIGKKEVFFDRRALNKLYVSNVLLIMAPASAIVLKDMLPEINAALGLALDVSELANPTQALGVGAVQGTLTLTVATTSLAYTGSVTFAWKRAPVGTFKESGPGTKVLQFGSLDAGYFGTVPESEVMNAIKFWNGVTEDSGANSGAVYAPTGMYYFKFAYKGRFIFVPSSYLATNLTWDEIYRMGCAYAPREPVVYPPAGVAPVPQTKVLFVKEGAKEWQLSPRLPRGNSLDPVDPMNATSPTKGGEIWDLYRHTTKNGSYGDGAWDNLPALAASSLELALNTILGILTSYWAAPPSFSTNGVCDKKSYRGPYWRPVLEVANDLKLVVGMRNIGASVFGRLPTPVLNITLPPPEGRLQGISGVRPELLKTFGNGPATVTVDVLDSPSSVQWVRDTLDGRPYHPSAVSITVTHPAP